MEEQNILFAHIYRMGSEIKSALKGITKQSDKLLYQGDWMDISMAVNTIIGELDVMTRTAEALSKVCDNFLMGGPYEGERGGSSPLEALAR